MESKDIKENQKVLQINTLNALTQLHDELFTKLSPLLSPTYLRGEECKEAESDYFEDVRKMFILERLKVCAQKTEVLNLQARVSPYSRPNEDELKWISLHSPLLPEAAYEKLIQASLKVDEPPARHITSVDYDGTSCWAKLQEITSTVEAKNSGRLGYLIAMFKTKVQLQQFDSAIQYLSSELATGMHMLRHAADRVIVAYLSSVISETGEQEEILKKISTLLAKHLRSDGIKISVMRNSAAGVRYQKMFRTDIPKNKPEYFKLDKKIGLTDWVLRHNDWLLIDNPSRSPGIQPDKGFSLNVDEIAVMARKESNGNSKKLDEEQTLFLYPLRILNRVVGVLSIWRATPHIYDRRLDLSSMQLIVPVVASELKWQIKQEYWQRKSEVLATLSHALLSKSSIKTVFSTFVSCVGLLANAARTILFLDDPGSKVLCALDNFSDGAEELTFWAEFLVPYGSRKDWRKNVKRAIMSRENLCHRGKDKLIVINILEITSKGFSGVVALLGAELEPIEKEFTLLEDQISQPILESFINETGPLLANSVEAFAQRSAQRFIEEEDAPNAYETPLQLLQRTAHHLREQTQCDAVMVYHYTSDGLKVSATSPLCESLYNMGFSRNSYTHKTVNKMSTIRIIDVKRDSWAQFDKIDSDILIRVKEAFGWREIRSWLCVPVVIDGRVVGLLKLLTSQDGIFLGPYHEKMVEILATRVESKMHQITQRVMLKALNDILEKLAPEEGTKLSEKMLVYLQDWSEKFIRPNTQIAIFAAIATPLPRLITHSTTMSKDLKEALEAIAEKRRACDGQIKIKNMHCLPVPIGIAGSDVSAGFLFVICKQRFSNLALDNTREAARELAIILDRERRRIEWIRKVGRFRHAVLGPVQGLSSAARRLHALIVEKKTNSNEIQELKINMEKEIESIRLWRENQRLYTGGTVQVVKRLNSLEAIIRTCVQRFDAVLRKRNIELKVAWNGNERLYFFFDRDGLELAITNLLDNANKYAFFHTNVIIGVERRRVMGNIEIWVEDTGHPIPPHLDGILYDAGTRLDWEDPLRAIHGTGLGLPMTQAIIRRHGGEIRHFSMQEEKVKIDSNSKINKVESNVYVELPKEEPVEPHRVRFTIEIPEGV